jgi:hypothetical protein
MILNTLLTGDANLRFLRFFALQLWKMDDAKLPFNTHLVFTHLIIQYMERTKNGPPGRIFFKKKTWLYFEIMICDKYRGNITSQQCVKHTRRGALTGCFRVVFDYTSQQDFVPQKVYCVSNVTFHAESKYAIKIFSITHSFCTMVFSLLIFRNFFLHEQIF